MNRRGFLGGMIALGAAPAKSEIELDALLVGDSHAYQLGPRFHKEAHARGRRVEVRAQGGTSAHQWLEKGWFRRAVAEYPARRIVVSLGTNCVKQERKILAHDFAELAKLAPWMIVLCPPTTAFDTGYIARAVGDAFSGGALLSFWFPVPLPPTQSDGVHATAAGLESWARVLAEALWS